MFRAPINRAQSPIKIPYPLNKLDARRQQIHHIMQDLKSYCSLANICLETARGICFHILLPCRLINLLLSPCYRNVKIGNRAILAKRYRTTQKPVRLSWTAPTNKYQLFKRGFRKTNKFLLKEITFYLFRRLRSHRPH